MSDCQECRERYCCIVQGELFCRVHCPRNQCYCIRCIIQVEIRRTEAERCQYCQQDACCYFALNTGIYQGQNSYRVTRVCPEHYIRVDCDCRICQEDPELAQQGTFLFAIPISHLTIIVRNGFPEAQAYVVDGDLDPQVAQDREEQLSQVSEGSRDTTMVLQLPAEDRSSERTAEADQWSRGDRRGRRGATRTRRSGNEPGPSQATARRANPTNGSYHRGMQLRERNNRGRVSVRQSGSTNSRRTHRYREIVTRSRSIRSRTAVDDPANNTR
jgi:hypothetical protein